MKIRRWHGKVLRCGCTGHDYSKDKRTEQYVQFPSSGKYHGICESCGYYPWYVGPPPKGVECPGMNFGRGGNK